MKLKSLINTIVKNEHLIAFDYNDKEDQILLVTELREVLFTLTEDKDLIKSAVREALELKSSDIVIIKTESIFIKIFDDSKRHRVTQEEQNTVANRYNGIDEDELISFYNDFFKKEENGNFFFSVAEQFVTTYLLEQHIDNATYEKYVFPSIQTIITKKLMEKLDNNSDFFNGFSGYIFRIHFKEVFGHIADLMLKEVARSNQYINEFIKYYSQNVIAVGGVKYKVPSLGAENGLKWNIISILSIVKIYVKIDISIQKLKDDKCRDALDLAKESNERKELTKEINDLKQELQELRDKKTELTSKLLNKHTIAKYMELEKELERIIRLVKSEEKMLENNKAAYLSIRSALVKALTSKKQKL
ncbi:MAG: hypothetical protein COW17_04250 [Sulfurimonas sp. CG12_big_fil_rev_8_21_14_0_65_36_1453]|nr:MAG: hypothetical protein COW17_04250 [Sulfurimonas sp. CG12_big_fil_rev_8_21_14_0_65_36_1453]